MEIAFRTKSLRRICESSTEAQEKLGDEVAKMLKHRLADLRAALYLSDLVWINLTERKSRSDNCLYIDLCDSVVLKFKPNQSSIVYSDDGTIDKKSVSRVIILGVGEENGN